VVELAGGVIRCYLDDLSDTERFSTEKSALFECPLSEKTNVVVHDTSYFERKKRKLNDMESTADVGGDELKYAFSLHYHDSAGLPAFLDLSTSLELERNNWTQQISRCVADIKRAAEAQTIANDNRLVEWRVSRDHMMNAPNVRVLLALKPTFRIKSTTLCTIKGFLNKYFKNY
jgi:hypothetical protein